MYNLYLKLVPLLGMYLEISKTDKFIFVTTPATIVLTIFGIVRSQNIIIGFRSQLKTYLFRLAYPPP